MNELGDAENLWIEASNTWIEIKKKKILFLQTVVWTNQKEKKSWRENETKNKIWSMWHIYKTDGLSARHWWIFLQDKNGNAGLKINHCSADLSGSATPLEYKHPHSYILTQGFTKKEKLNALLVRQDILHGHKSVMFST